jgi:hypothetical protein
MTSTKASAPLKSSGLAVYSGSSLLAAVAAIIRSEARLRGSRPDARTDAQIWPNSRAAPWSYGSGSKVASTCCKTATRPARLTGSSVARGPKENSPYVTAVTSIRPGSSAGSYSLSAAITLVSTTPAPCGVTARSLEGVTDFLVHEIV